MHYGHMPPLGVRTSVINVNVIIVIDEYVLSDCKYCVLTVYGPEAAPSMHLKSACLAQ